MLAEIKAEQKPEDQFETVLFLPEGEGRQGEGGLRTRGYFKKSDIDKPLITVVTIVFNGEEHLEETILSIINQTYDNVEYIVIDGASTDGTVDLIRKYEHAIDYWASEKDSGIYDAMNKGVKSATGEWLYFLNTNDRFIESNILDRILPFFHNFREILHFNCDVVDSNKKKVPVRRYPVFPKSLKKWPCVQHQSVFTHRKVIKCVGLFSLQYQLLSDYEFFVRASATGYLIQAHREWKVAIFNAEGISANSSNALTIKREARHIQLEYFGKVYYPLQFQLTFKFILGSTNFGKKIFSCIRRISLVER